MTMELVDGRAGQPHIDSQDMAILHQALFGAHDYVFDYGEQLACTMQDANHAIIGTGAAMIQGLAWTVTGAETVKIDSGAQGVRRHDVICAHYHRDQSMVESISLDVIKGDPTDDPVASDPEIPYTDILSGDTDAYMPLWRIPIDGITVGTPVSMFALASNGLFDIASQQSFDTLEISKLVSDPDWSVNGFVLAGVATISVRWTNVNRFHINAWGNHPIAEIENGWQTDSEFGSWSVDDSKFNDCWFSFSGNRICFRSRSTHDIPPNVWHLCTISGPVHK